jgi:hypothetical protein
MVTILAIVPFISVGKWVWFRPGNPRYRRPAGAAMSGISLTQRGLLPTVHCRLISPVHAS